MIKKQKTPVLLKIDQRVRSVFFLLLILTVILNQLHLSFYPSLAFPIFKSDEFSSVCSVEQREKVDYKNLLRDLYPHDKRYFLFLQRALENPKKYQKTTLFIRKMKKE